MLPQPHGNSPGPRAHAAVGRYLLALLLVCAGTEPAAATDAAERAYRAVDPMIGTGGDGHTFPGAVVPFGMVQPSPDTDVRHFKQSYRWAAGYRHEDGSILGFSQTHFSGTGHSDLGDVLLMPMSGEARLEPGSVDAPGSGYRSRFSHDDEQAEPGYYAVTLGDAAVRVELTASERVAWHRYRFASGQRAHVVLDLRRSVYDHDGKVTWSRLRVRPDGTVTGYRSTRGWAPDRQVYFALRFSAQVLGRELHNREEAIEYKGFKAPGTGPADRAQVEGRRLVAAFDFGPLEAPLVVKVAISPVSEDGAIANLEREAPGWDFDATRASARAAWRDALSVLEVEADAATRTMLYTALYHTLIAPSLYMDVDGRYRGPDHAVHSADGFRYHSTFSLWDTYRALHPLLTLVQPAQRNADFVQSLLASRRASPYGLLPVWAFHGLETWCMIGYHAVPVIADAYLKGVRGYSADEALAAVVASSSYGPYGGLAHYLELGYVPIDREPEGASKTLEYAYDDWTIARLAAALGRDDVAAEYTRRARNWRHVFDRDSGFVRARLADGRFREPFDPAAVGYGSDYTEGNAWQYSWYQPHDAGGLIEMLGGDARLVGKLDAVFDARVDPASFAHVEDISGLIGHYAHGNEPSHHVAYLYVHAGQPWRTQQRLTQIVASQYRAAPDGLAGNDDCGQMSAWYVFTALGFYPVAPGSGEYVIGRPFVGRASLRLPNGKRFTIVAERLGEQRPYVGSVRLNGEPLQRSVLRHEEIMAGGELRFRMQREPNTRWATAASARPYSMTSYRAD
jgi:predicted alpha-1,2-mannosidase